MPLSLRRSLFRVSIAAVIVVIAVAGMVRVWLDRPLPLPAVPYAFEVRPGASLAAVARELAAAGIISDRRVLIALARLSGVDRSIKAGNYEIAGGTTLPQLLARLSQGDVTQTALTIVEGITFADVRAALAANPNVATISASWSDREVWTKIGGDAGEPEGWIFPDTYFFATNAPDIAILARARRLMGSRLAAAWTRRRPDTPLASPYEALILASIVEKETGRAADRPLVASVFVNRLKRGMRLQSDPTVIYGMGKRFDGNLRRADLIADTAYNTYTRDGLPPTPIALPGQASLDAVVDPPVTAFLYFVSRGDGTSEFTTNLADHNRAVSKFQRGGR